MAFRLPVGRISGRALDGLSAVTQTVPFKLALAALVRSELGIDAARRLGADFRGPLPITILPRRARERHERRSAGLDLPRRSEWPRSALDLTDAYRSGQSDPVSVVERAFAIARELASRTPSLGPLLESDEARAREGARASRERWQRGEPLGPLDGVPIAVKEEIDVEGLHTRLGTCFEGRLPARRDAAIVRRLRESGAIVLGQTPMTEYGLSPLGANPHRTLPRNAHDPERLAGGSSTGSAVGVALGAFALGVGTDGGGSIRTPAAYNGIFGIKPTYGRLPLTGHGVPSGTSVIHFGLLAGTSHDLAASLDRALGPDSGDPASLAQPPAPEAGMVGALARGVSGLTIGVPEAEWQRADPPVARACRAALAELERRGARLLPLTLPLAAHAAAIGYLTIAVEARAALRAVEAAHHRELGADLRVFLAGVDGFASDDYVDAQRLREKLREEAARALAEVDLIALPTTAGTAPLVTDDEMRSGFIDTAALDAACRFVFLANLSGLPAASAPVGVDPAGLPVGLQLIGDAWDEATLFAAFAELERAEVARCRRPRAALDLLG